MPFRCVASITPVDRTKPPPDHVIPSERSESRNPPKWQILPCVGTFLPRGGFLHSACAPVGMTQWGAFLRIRLLFLECFTLPRPSSVRAAPCQLPRRGSFCTVVWGWWFYRNIGAKGPRPSPQKLSIVNSKKLSTVNCQLPTFPRPLQKPHQRIVFILHPLVQHCFQQFFQLLSDLPALVAQG